MKNIFSVKQKIIVVTGGLGQLGRQYALALAERGARVAIFDIGINEQATRPPFGTRKQEGNLAFLSVDVTNRKSIEMALRKVHTKWGVPDGLINNAGLDSPPGSSKEQNGPFETYPTKAFDRVMDVNVKGVFLCCQVIGGAMAETGRGSIINIGSTYGLVSPDQRIYKYREKTDQPFFKPVAYSVSKASLLNLTRYLSTYWAKCNVRINTLSIGGVFNNQDKEFLDGYCNRVPMNRMANEDEYVGPVIFLLSEASSYMTGANLIVDGGWTAW